jgi:dTDP-4-dehydrorhamnose reductase
MSTRVALITGAGGQVGQEASELFATAGWEVVACDRHRLDISDRAAVLAAVADSGATAVVNLAAWNAVDAAETDLDGALAVNAIAVRHLAEACRRTGARLCHVSTDYVFDGTATTPYEPSDPTNPRTADGRTKLAGETEALRILGERTHIVRTAWVYGGPGANFVDTMRRLESERPSVNVVADQLGSPTFAGDLAEALIALGRSDAPPGVLHFANAGQASWFDLARETFRLVGADPQRVHPVTTADFPRPAPRPAWSVLSSAAWVAAGLPAPRPWQDALAAALG